MKILSITNCNKVFTKIFSTQAYTEWKSVIGLEIHAQILTKTKLFSAAENSFAKEINSCVALLDLAMPGCLALNCCINEVSMFDRKHYFYSDLPAGYQITQQRFPLATKGFLKFPVLDPMKSSKIYYKTVRLHQLQLEQDSGKSLHDDQLGISLIDLNRAGVPLMELVFEPDLSNGEEAASLVKELILIFEIIETCSCKMEDGALRVIKLLFLPLNLINIYLNNYR
jgi:aspartyl-tRNA(Asn)/glutamyl-tRNA(Gln) amidotransferase subunit B